MGSGAGELWASMERKYILSNTLLSCDVRPVCAWYIGIELPCCLFQMCSEKKVKYIMGFYSEGSFSSTSEETDERDPGGGK